jgi:hypothetical protein
MTYTPSASNVMLGRGALYFDRRTATDNKVGSFHLGNCDQFGINISTEKITLRLHAAVDLALQGGRELDDVALTIAGLRVLEGHDGAGDDGRDRLHVHAEQRRGDGRSARLGDGDGPQGPLRSSHAYRNISAVVLKQGATTFVLNTDYTMDDATRGIINI